MNEQTSRPRYLQSVLSAIIPGLGQAIGGVFVRGLFIFLSIVVLSGLTVFTAAQRARFPDYAFSYRVFITFMVESAALLIFVLALFYLLRRYALKEGFLRSISPAILIIMAALALALAAPAMISTAVPADRERELYTITALLSATCMVSIWLWNIGDAARVRKDRQPSNTPLILLVIVAILVLGTRITQIDLPKAIREYKDTQIVLRRIVWPWEAAFDYEASELRARAKVQAPCPEGATGPEPNEPAEEGPWIVVTPTCGDLSVRDKKGKLTFGTLLTIEGGGFQPGLVAHIEWENPIGNAFTPRGVGETEIEVGPDGTFTTQLYVPDVTIPAVAEGPQIHTLHVYQRGAAQFTGRLSREMKLALQGMLETIMMGLMATFAGIILSIPLSFLAARNLMHPIHTTAQGFVGGVIGLALGGWAGKVLASYLSNLAGGLQEAPILTATLHALLILALAILAFRLLARLLDEIARRLHAWVGRIISIIGLGVIGATLGWVLGLAYAYGIISITQTAEAAAATAPQAARIGATIVGLIFAALTLRMGDQDHVPVGRIVYTLVRLILNIVRSIEPLIWAIMGVIWIGPGPFAGFIALTIHSVAALGKLYSESIESINSGPIEALQATGANRLQTIVYAVVPQVLPPFTAFTLYRWDINVRMSTVIGLVGGGGIGFLLIQWIRQFQYEQAGIAVWLITITVATLDFISASIREKLV